MTDPLATSRSFAALTATSICCLVVIGFLAPSSSIAQEISMPPSQGGPTRHEAGGGPARSSAWSVSLGGGARLAPKYEGSEELKISPLPFVAISWNDLVFLDVMNGLGVYAVRTENFRLGTSIGYGQGRDQDDADRLRGLGDIDSAARTRIFGSYQIRPAMINLDVSRDFGGSDGLQIRTGVMMPFPLSQKMRLLSGISTTWADDAYMESFFGVTPVQSARSSLPTFQAEGGLKRVDLELGLMRDIGEHWFARGIFGLGYLLGDAAESPVTETELQASLGMFVGYKF